MIPRNTRIDQTCALFVGIAPSRNGDPTTPLEGPIGLRLANLLDLSREHFLRNYSRINLNLDAQDTFDWREAEQTVRRILKRREPKLVLLGRTVASAFEFLYQPLHVGSRESKLCFLLPHPSGLNRWWNDPSNILLARKYLRKFIYEN